MSWREEAQKLFPTISLDDVPRASVPTVPAFLQIAEVGTPDTLARLTSSVYDAHQSLWTDWQERAAIMEYDGGLTRTEAESAATDVIRLEERRIK